VPRRISSARATRPAAAAPRAFLYVEGPRDREIIEGWAQRAPRLAHRVREATVILGGRQPARAREHLAEARAELGDGVRGLCVLDRDQEQALENGEAEGLELYVWSRRHIESYLLVPAAIARAVRSIAARDLRALEAELPGADDARAWRDLDAKRRLSAHGARFPWGRVARTLRDDELHADVHDFLARLSVLFDTALAPTVTKRTNGA
jgi:hypothetical protein